MYTFSQFGSQFQRTSTLSASSSTSGAPLGPVRQLNVVTSDPQISRLENMLELLAHSLYQAQQQAEQQKQELAESAPGSPVSASEGGETVPGLSEAERQLLAKVMQYWPDQTPQNRIHQIADLLAQFEHIYNRKLRKMFMDLLSQRWLFDLRNNLLKEDCKAPEDYLAPRSLPQGVTLAAAQAALQEEEAPFMLTRSSQILQNLQARQDLVSLAPEDFDELLQAQLLRRIVPAKAA